jgi:ribosomal protein RSM22 (predicted rRNA methylase)
MLRTRVLGQLNRAKVDKTHIDHLKQLKPDLEKKARYCVNRFVKAESLVLQVLDGLAKTGLEITEAFQ